MSWETTFLILRAGARFIAVALLWGAPSLASASFDSDRAHVETDRDRQIRELRDAEVTQIRIALGRRNAANRQADLYFRLAELYFEGYRADHLIEGKIHEYRAQEKRAPRNAERRLSRPLLTRGIKACEELVALGVPYAKMDNVIYFLAYNYGELGQAGRAEKYFKQLVEDHPKSTFRVEAYRELGEQAFRRHEFKDAIGYFEQALPLLSGGPRAPIYHRLAWSHYRLRELDRAVTEMKRAISEAEKSGEQFLNVRDEALKDLAVFMTDAGQVEEALAYFRSVVANKEFYAEALEKLAAEYERRLQWASAIKVHELLLRISGNADRKLPSLLRIIDADLKMAQHARALGRLEVFPWQELNAESSQVPFQQAKNRIRRWAVALHAEARKRSAKDSKGTYELVDRLYGLYLEKFLVHPVMEPLESKKGPTRSEEVAEVQTYRAEVKAALGARSEATRLYRVVMESGHPKYAVTAGKLRLALLTEAVTVAHAKPGSDEASLWLETVDQSSTVAPTSPESRALKLKAIQFLAGSKEHEGQVIDRTRKLIDESPESQEALIAAQLWIQVRLDTLPKVADVNAKTFSTYQDRARAVEEVFEVLGKNERLMRADRTRFAGKLASVMRAKREEIRLGLVAGSEAGGDFEGAARAYENLASTKSERSVSEPSLLNALTNYQRARNWGETERLALQVSEKFAGSKKTIDNVKGAATQLLIAGEYDRSARVFFAFGSRHRDKAAVRTAMTIAAATGSKSESATWTAYFIEHFKGDSDWDAIVLEEAKRLERDGEHGKAITLFGGCSQRSSIWTAECLIRLADVYTAQGKVRDAQSAIQRAAGIRVDKNSGRVSPFVGLARFRLAETSEKQTTFEPLSLPDSKLEKLLSERLKFFEKLSTTYLAAGEAGGPWAIGSLLRLAEWTLRLAREIEAIGPPENVRDELAIKFKKSLLSVSRPLIDRARKTLKDAFRLAQSQEILSSFTGDVLDLLAEIEKKPPYRAQGSFSDPRWAVPEGLGQEVSLEAIRTRLSKQPLEPSLWNAYGVQLVGQGKTPLAAIAFARALDLDSKSGAALNNTALAMLAVPEALEDPVTSRIALGMLKQARSVSKRPREAIANLAQLYGYYRLAMKADPLWEWLHEQTPDALTWDGTALGRYFKGDLKSAEKAFQEAEARGADEDRMMRRLFQAATSDREACRDYLMKADKNKARPLEQAAWEHLRMVCQKEGS